MTARLYNLLINAMQYPQFPIRFQIVFSIVYSTIVFLLTDQPLEMHRYTRFTIVYILLTLAADGFGLCLGACANPVVCILFIAQ